MIITPLWGGRAVPYTPPYPLPIPVIILNNYFALAVTVASLILKLNASVNSSLPPDTNATPSPPSPPYERAKVACEYHSQHLQFWCGQNLLIGIPYSSQKSQGCGITSSGDGNSKGIMWWVHVENILCTTREIFLQRHAATRNGVAQH